MNYGTAYVQGLEERVVELRARAEAAEGLASQQHTLLQFLGPFAEFFERLNAPDCENYLTATLDVRKDERPWVLTAQREGGKTPAERIDEIRKEADAQRARADALAIEVEAGARQDAIRKREIADVVKQRDGLQVDLERHQSALLQVRKAAGLSIHSNDNIAEHVARLLAERDQARAERDALRTECESLGAERVDMLDQRDVARARVAELEQQLAAAAEYRAGLRGQVDDLQAHVAKAEAESAARRAALTALRDEQRREADVLYAQGRPTPAGACASCADRLDAILAGNAPAGMAELSLCRYPHAEHKGLMCERALPHYGPHRAVHRGVYIKWEDAPAVVEAAPVADLNAAQRAEGEAIIDAERWHKAFKQEVEAHHGTLYALANRTQERDTLAQAVAALADEWEREAAAYPQTSEGGYARAGVTLCARALRALLPKAPPPAAEERS